MNDITEMRAHFPKQMIICPASDQTQLKKISKWKRYYITSLSDKYIRSQFEKIKSTESSEMESSGDVTSAHTNLTFL